MLHHGRLIKQSDPLFPLSAFNYESKNRILKLCGDSTYSCVNITYTITMKEQLKVANQQVKKTFQDKILCNENGNICFLYLEWYTVGFEENIHAYAVTSTEKAKSILMENLLFPRLVIYHVLNTKSYIALR